jgi:hypothetical protein
MRSCVGGAALTEHSGRLLAWAQSFDQSRPTCPAARTHPRGRAEPARLGGGRPGTVAGRPRGLERSSCRRAVAAAGRPSSSARRAGAADSLLRSGAQLRSGTARRAAGGGRRRGQRRAAAGRSSNANSTMRVRGRHLAQHCCRSAPLLPLFVRKGSGPLLFLPQLRSRPARPLPPWRCARCSQVESFPRRTAARPLQVLLVDDVRGRRACAPTSDGAAKLISDASCSQDGLRRIVWTSSEAQPRPLKSTLSRPCSPRDGRCAWCCACRASGPPSEPDRRLGEAQLAEASGTAPRWSSRRRSSRGCTTSPNARDCVLDLRQH